MSDSELPETQEEPLIAEQVVPEADEEEPPTVEEEPPTVEPELVVEVAPELVAVAPTRIHPAAVVGYVPTPEEANGEKFFIGFWSGRRNYGCPYCTYSTLSGNGAVELHIFSRIDQGVVSHLVYLDEV